MPWAFGVGKRTWCADLPLVQPPKAPAPKFVTVIVPYYENATFLDTQVRVWRAYPPDLARHLAIHLVDDGSPVPCVNPGLPNLRLFRIGVDVRWNWLAARNIGAHHAKGGWLLLTDMDHVLPADTLRAVVEGAHDSSVVYVFSRREHTGESIGPHSASFLMTRDLFWTIGGYDETLSGHYGTDGDFRRRLIRHAQMMVLREALVRHEYVGDSSTTRYLRKQPEDAAVSRLIAKRSAGWRPKVLSFPYTEVLS